MENFLKTLSLWILLFATAADVAYCRAARSLRGTTKTSPSNLFFYSFITHGEVAPKNRFPYMCSTRRADKAPRCGGILFLREWVITAAHCVTPAWKENPIVYCGLYDVENPTPDQTFQAIKTFVPPQWDGVKHHGYDIALLKLNRQATFQKPRFNLDGIKPGTGTVFAATGWGKTETGVYPHELRMATHLPYVDQKTCERKWGRAVPPIMICAGLYSQDTCTGDSGGPLMMADAPYGRIENGKPGNDIIFGVTSFGDENCDASVKPAIYTNIADFADWLKYITTHNGEEDWV